ncbi:hypothetical protein CFOLD11_11830 [Clostridium folliculivorans]|uniref:Uncharacterized protein n=1 Tax=Clostridium folliculivorans TaxID=2886038 RepID=A0A9W5Y0N6_9CLOT|nr:hypothetical protein [Clostridium folliculivorans]GKU24357.1 hypothetical protein CFOLD11_11830 [Clostridium folliculivorans]
MINDNKESNTLKIITGIIKEILDILSWIWIAFWVLFMFVIIVASNNKGGQIIGLFVFSAIASSPAIIYIFKRRKIKNNIVKDNLLTEENMSHMVQANAVDNSEDTLEIHNKNILKDKRFINKRGVVIAIVSIIIIVAMANSIFNKLNPRTSSIFGTSSDSNNMISLEKVRDDLKLNEKLEKLFYSNEKLPTNNLIIDIKVGLKKYKLKNEKYNEYLNKMISEISFVDYKRQQRIDYEENKYKDCGKLYLIQKNITAEQYKNSGMYYKTGSGSSYEVTDVSITSESYSFINEYLKKQFLENQSAFINQADERYSFMKGEDPKGIYYQDRINYSQDIIDSIRKLSDKSGVQISQDTDTKLKRLSDYLEVCKNQIKNVQEAATTNKKIYDANSEKEYVAKVKDSLLQIGKENIIISQELSNFSSSDRLPKAMKNLQSACKELKELSSPSDRFAEIDGLIDQGCSEYIDSAASIGRAVTQFDSSYIDESVNQSKEAGNYFKQALSKMNEYGYKIQ